MIPQHQQKEPFPAERVLKDIHNTIWIVTARQKQIRFAHESNQQLFVNFTFENNV